MTILIWIILLFITYIFYNKNINKEYSQNPVEKCDKEEKMYKFLGKILGFLVLYVFFYYIETYPNTTTKIRPSYSNTTTNGLLKLFF